MGFYERHILPYFIRVAMQSRNLAAYRARVIAGAKGRVLEVGIGAGMNLACYGPEVRELIGIDVSPKMLAMARREAGRRSVPVTLMEASAEAIPCDSQSFDAVVTTWTLCSIDDPAAALHEMRRVLKPDGRLLFVEHGLAPEAGVRKWQDRLTPAWKHLAGGCHLNRPMRTLIENAGFKIERLDTGYMRGTGPMTFMYEGCARSEHPWFMDGAPGR